jgi:hypothetical protein
MKPIGLGLFTLRVWRKALHRGNKGQINDPAPIDLGSGEILEEIPANWERSKTKLDKPNYFNSEDDKRVTNEDMIPAWFAYLGLCHN